MWDADSNIARRGARGEGLGGENGKPKFAFSSRSFANGWRHAGGALRLWTNQQPNLRAGCRRCVGDARQIAGRQLHRDSRRWIGDRLHQQGRCRHRTGHRVPAVGGRRAGRPHRTRQRDPGRHGPRSRSRRHGREFRHRARRERYSAGGCHRAGRVARAGVEATEPFARGIANFRRRNYRRQWRQGHNRCADRRQTIRPESGPQRAPQESFHLYRGWQIDPAYRCAGQMHGQASLPARFFRARDAAWPGGAAARHRLKAAGSGRVFAPRNSRCSRDPHRELSGGGGERRMGGGEGRSRPESHMDRLEGSARQRRAGRLCSQRRDRPRPQGGSARRRGCRADRGSEGVVLYLLLAFPEPRLARPILRDRGL